jgi:hypothetical protein
LKLDYHYGLGKIYTVEETEKAKQSPGFDREYGLQYLGKAGNVFSPLQIDRTIELGEKYSLDKIPINDYALHSRSCFPGLEAAKIIQTYQKRL